ncbi:MAG: Ribosomal large subunit pseudouridine synthase F [Candidatus Nomurabacteria bacterium GW2011_GWE1_32_28]|uniref:Pseudouridine synthase n=1 Tax=Candidatus Nomurabacteria bacterium GW2011_GWF1_31_48 TaxID=1618767 RepID=A0A0G0AUK9_9BACT|nr:MAG: Ribosomal large subunit pseudouridine synthase F [Candidatus Nomurabacteria bacterium GW2011_GWF2_30_133]KKP28767.1 MAG: Ribosomal large subunit pseudouridine synthase F [Candidatus Nomurabacteria bacterium GW2011_GWE2_31_40]KKP30345.1 MAG: Ribosomal large subunit pseudouridine synthase F [Candidatus Nomurabacteria bacterium GW2011_GWF1_31_48]KKP34872.1 MAG: Ribosomal large subunit pseudouridine synthase F [Candidatus Nomurabacteria bacterium GW2011_GWE1_32_28]HAS80963.1 23S rRNA pseudo
MENLYPMRINKYLAWKKISTRRGADELVENKKVFINDKLALLGSKVNENDKVEIKGNKNPKVYVYFAYNKPIDTITHSPQKGEHDIKEDIKNTTIPKDVFPIGRLDKNSHGLIILTNDGRITDQLLSPKYSHEKEYIVRTSNKLRSNFKQKMEAGVNIEGYFTKRCKVTIVNENTFRVILTEGKKHQIRRMCSALFQEVADLKRERVMNIKLNNLKSNGFREIKGKELTLFLNKTLNQT